MNALKFRQFQGSGMTSDTTRNRMVSRLKANGISNPQVLDAMSQVPRHCFVDEAIASRSYDDQALPIGFGQTISQPLIVATMSQALLADGPLERVLEVGVGCGYQTAVLAMLVGKVCGVERIAALQKNARQRLRSLGIRNITIKHGDGYQGWPEYAPFDAILVSAVAREIPEPLVEQLTVGGRLILPIENGSDQELLQVVRTADSYTTESLGKVSFVPLKTGTE